MTATLLDGKKLAETIREEIRLATAEFTAETKVQPSLTVILVGENPASQVYVRNKETACVAAGMKSDVVRLPESTGTAELLALIGRLNADATVHGILVQLPLPKGIDEKKILEKIYKETDSYIKKLQKILK